MMPPRRRKKAADGVDLFAGKRFTDIRKVPPPPPALFVPNPALPLVICISRGRRIPQPPFANTYPSTRGRSCNIGVILRPEKLPVSGKAL